MKINRHNYEEYFILYADNEMSREDRGIVELFVRENPDLEEELAMLQQSRLIADTSVVFSGKEILMKSAGDQLINMKNYEECLQLYIDNELTKEQKTAVEKFINNHPAVKTALELFQKTKLQPEENIVFLNKESLYRREEKPRVVAIHWWRIAAATVLLFAVSIPAFILINQKKNSQEIASGSKKVKESTQDNLLVKKTGDKTKPGGPIVIDGNGEKTEKGTNTIDNPVATKKSNAAKEKTEYLPVQVKEENLIAENDEKNKNNLPQPYDPNMKKSIEESKALASLNTSPNEALTNLKENNRLPVVTPHISQPSYTSNALTNTNDEIVDAGQPEKKNKFRGLLRRVTRTFEKTTNIKATDEDDRLLVGGLAIKL